jgi:hypothetical protein
VTLVELPKVHLLEYLAQPYLANCDLAEKVSSRYFAWSWRYRKKLLKNVIRVQF